MTPRRRRSLLEDDSLVVVGGRDEASSGDVCERCGHTRGAHSENGCGVRNCKCGEFEDDVEG